MAESHLLAEDISRDQLLDVMLVASESIDAYNRSKGRTRTFSIIIPKPELVIFKETPIKSILVDIDPGMYPMLHTILNANPEPVGEGQSEVEIFEILVDSDPNDLTAICIASCVVLHDGAYIESANPWHGIYIDEDEERHESEKYSSSEQTNLSLATLLSSYEIDYLNTIYAGIIAGQGRIDQPL